MSDLSNQRKPILVKKETYRLWFEFYKIAVRSTDYQLRKNIATSKDFYAAWGDVSEIKFDNWWSSHSHLFEQRSVRVITDKEFDFEDNKLLLEVPLNESTSDLLNKIKTLIDANRSNPEELNKKNKTIISSYYKITDGAEPKLRNLREVLNVYRDVYLENKGLKGKKRYLKVLEYYESRPRNKRIPPALVDESGCGDDPRAMKNLGRWIGWANKIVLNVSLGEFPGVYK